MTNPAQEPHSAELASEPHSWQPTQAFLRYAIVTILVASAVFLALVFFVFPEQRARALGPAMLSPVALISAALLKFRRPRAAVLFMAGGVWVAVTVVATLYGGIRSTIYYVYPLVIFLLGWLVGTRAAVISAFLTGCVTVLLIVAESHQWLPPSRPAEPLLYGVVQIFVFLLTAALVIYLVQAYRRQIQALQQAGAEMAHVNEVLRQSELKFATAFTSSPVAVSIATADTGRVLELNENFERDFGWTTAQLRGRTALELGLWPDQPTRQKFADQLLQYGRVVNYETVWRHKNGDLRNVSLSAEVIELEGQLCILAFTTDITGRKAAEEQIQRLAFYDPLTTLPNRRLLMDRLEHAVASCQRHTTHGALLFIDLDDFKTINDTHGHDTGDQLLQEVAARLKACVRDDDTVARLGGDEFVVMLEDLSHDPDEAARQAEGVGRKVLARLAQPYMLQGVQIHSTPSMGATLFGAEHEPLDEPLRRADMAMYQAKAAGRNTIRFFEPRMQAMVFARAALEDDLRQARGNSELSLHYQPQVDQEGRVTGVEALLRWQHPKRGMVSPAEYISLAEETGLILSLGEFVLEEACTQLAKWARMPAMAHLAMSINVSQRQFQHNDFVQQVHETLRRTGAPPQRLKLELTESMLAANMDELIERMAAIRAYGVGFSLDDFGTGYSSLVYLKRLPLAQLKIDQGFVRDILVDPNDAAIARMIIVLADQLGLDVIAEGVETVEQQEALYTLGCRAYQGFLYSRPLATAQLDALAARPDWPVLPRVGQPDAQVA